MMKFDQIRVYIFEMFAASILQQVKATSKNGEALTPQDEASLVMYQLPSAEEVLPILSILPEVTSLHFESVLTNPYVFIYL